MLNKRVGSMFLFFLTALVDNVGEMQLHQKVNELLEERSWRFGMHRYASGIALSVGKYLFYPLLHAEQN